MENEELPLIGKFDFCPKCSYDTFYKSSTMSIGTIMCDKCKTLYREVENDHA
jgi:hypothetical protein